MLYRTSKFDELFAWVHLAFLEICPKPFICYQILELDGCSEVVVILQKNLLRMVVVEKDRPKLHTCSLSGSLRQREPSYLLARKDRCHLSES